MDTIIARLAFLTKPSRDVTLLNIQPENGDFKRYKVTDEQLARIIADGIADIVDEIVRKKKGGQ